MALHGFSSEGFIVNNSTKKHTYSNCLLVTTISSCLTVNTLWFLAVSVPCWTLYLPLSCSPTVPSMLQTGERRRKCAITSSVLPSTEIMWLLTSWNRRSSTSWPISTAHGGQCHRGELKMRGTVSEIILWDIFRLPMHRILFDRIHYTGQVLTCYASYI